MTTSARTPVVGCRPVPALMPAACRDGAAAGKTPEPPMTTTPCRGVVSAGRPPAHQVDPGQQHPQCVQRRLELPGLGAQLLLPVREREPDPRISESPCNAPP